MTSEDQFPTDPRIDYDANREAGIVPGPHGTLIASRHADVVQIANDAATFSSAVSRFLQVPNGLDGAEHASYRELLDPFFAPARMAELEPKLRQVATELLTETHRQTMIEAVSTLGSSFAVRAMVAWLGWPADLEPRLLAWMDDNHEASRSGELVRTAQVADDFNQIIREVIGPRMLAAESSEPHDVTDELIALINDGRPDATEILVSILRNWTGGDLGSIALCIGVIVHWLATHAEHIADFRDLDDAALDRAIDEILRIDDPFVSNRRVATRDTEVSGCPMKAGQRVVLNWTAANRDPRVFGDPDAFDPEANAANNIVYGTGPHICPGRPLATLELRVFTRALLDAMQTIELAGPSERELPPVGGYRKVLVRLG